MRTRWLTIENSFVSIKTCYTHVVYILHCVWFWFDFDSHSSSTHTRQLNDRQRKKHITTRWQPRRHLAAFIFQAETSRVHKNETQRDVIWLLLLKHPLLLFNFIFCSSSWLVSKILCSFWYSICTRVCFSPVYWYDCVESLQIVFFFLLWFNVYENDDSVMRNKCESRIATQSASLAFPFGLIIILVIIIIHTHCFGFLCVALLFSTKLNDRKTTD